jgi:mRNA interferase HicA
MTGNEFLDRVRSYARRQRLSFEFDASSGKGSHGRLYLGNRHTAVKDRKKEIGSGLLSKMCRDPGISQRDLYDL